MALPRTVMLDRVRREKAFHPEFPLRKYFQSLLVIAALSFGCVVGRCETTNALKFYIVSEEKIEGGKLIDTPALRKVGYISATADLVVTNLLDVYREKLASSFVVDGKVVRSNPPPRLGVALPPEDAKRFKALTAKAVGKRLLVTLGDKPLTAKVFTSKETDRFSIQFSAERELKAAQDELKKLIPAE